MLGAAVDAQVGAGIRLAAEALEHLDGSPEVQRGQHGRHAEPTREDAFDAADEGVPCQLRGNVVVQPVVEGLPVPRRRVGRAPWRVYRYGRGHAGEPRRGVAERRFSLGIGGRHGAGVDRALALTPVHGGTFAVSRENRDAELLGEGYHSRLSRIDPLGTSVDEGAIGQVIGEHASANAVLRLDHQDVRAGAGQRASGDQTGQPGADDHDLAGSQLLSCAPRMRLTERRDPSG